MDAEIKKTIDGRTKEFKEKLAKLAYEKAKQILSPEAQPLKGKGYPYQEEVELGENKIFFVKVGDGRDSMVVKTKASNSREAMKKMRDEYPKKKVSLDRNQKQGQPAGAFESIEEESDSKEFQQKYMEDVNEQEIEFSLDESVLVERLRLRNPNKVATIDIDYIGSSSDINQSQRQHNIKIKKTGRQMADVTGKKGDIVAFLQGDAYAMDDEDIKELFPELLEAKLNELNARYGIGDMKQSSDPKVKREFGKLKKVEYGSLAYIRQYKEVEAALDQARAKAKPKVKLAAGYGESVEIEESVVTEESDSKEFQQEIDMIANMIKKGEHERLAKMLKRDKALKKGGGWNMAQKPSKKQKDQYNKMIGDHKKKHRRLYEDFVKDAQVEIKKMQSFDLDFDIPDYKKAIALYKSKNLKGLKKLIYGLDTEPSEDLAMMIAKNDRAAFDQMYPNAKPGDYIRSIVIKHGA